jgi:hypothetical protein
MVLVYSIPIVITPVNYSFSKDKSHYGAFEHNEVYCSMLTKEYEQVVPNLKNIGINETNYLTDPDRLVGTKIFADLGVHGDGDIFDYSMKDSITIYKFPENTSISSTWLYLVPQKDEVTDEEIEAEIDKVYNDLLNDGPIDNAIIENHLKYLESLAISAKNKFN